MSRESPGAQMVPSGVEPEAAAVLPLEDAVAGAGVLVLPGVIGGRDLHTHRSDRKMLADLVTVRRKAVLFHERSHVLRRVILAGYRSAARTTPVGH